MIFILNLFLLIGSFLLLVLGIGMYVANFGDGISKLRKVIGVIFIIISLAGGIYGVYLLGIDGLTLIGII